MIEYIDIGGITLIRAAAKNHRHVTLLTDPSQYAAVIEEIQRDGVTSLATRTRLAADAFALTATYDAAISRTLSFGSSRPSTTWTRITTPRY